MVTAPHIALAVLAWMVSGSVPLSPPFPAEPSPSAPTAAAAPTPGAASPTPSTSSSTLPPAALAAPKGDRRASPQATASATPSAAPAPTPALSPVPAEPTPQGLADGGPDYATTLRYILAHLPPSVRASEVRAGSRPRSRYRIDYASTSTFDAGTHCDLDVTNTFVEAFTDTNEAVRGLDPPQLFALDDGSGRNVYSPAFTGATSARSQTYDKLQGADRNTYTWNDAFVYHFNGVDLSRLRLVGMTDPEKRETFEPFLFTDRETAQRVLRAVTRAAKLCGANTSDPFAAGPTPSPDPFASSH